jgi:outer membrane receptor protein involved in Fe transport
MNGTVLLNSKNPFKYKGLSFQIKTGLMHADKSQRPTPSPYYDWAVRWADNITPRLAFKMGAQLIQAKDWVANDESNYQVGDVSRNDYGKVVAGTRATDPNYDGVNVYGDETSVDLRQFLQGVIATNPAQLTPILGQFLSKPMPVSRTGYKESEVVNPNTVNFKLNGALHYKLTDKLEASLTAYWGTGNTVYTGSDRYSFKELRMGQYKLELKHPNWYLRAYTTQENAGEAYNATIATRIFNEAWKPSYNPANVSGSWYIQYAGAFAQNAAGIFTNVLTSGGSLAQAQASVGAALSNLHTTGRLIADAGRPLAGSTAFKTLFDNVRLTPIKKGGGLLLDASDLYQYEGQYNFSHLTGKAFDLIAGATFKRYRINSQGTIFADSSGPINIDEVGAYAQASRSLFNDHVKLSASGRYDKNTNFSGRFTPRFTMVIKLAENHNLRASYQTAYRFPTTQNQWINLQVGSGTVLLGGLPSLRKFYNFRTINQLYDNPNGGLPAYTLESVRAAGALLAQGNVPGALKTLQEAEFGEYKPETMKSFEVGYKGLFNNKFLVDMYAYFGRYENFLGRQIVVQSLSASPTAPFLGPNRVLSIAVNSKDNVRTYGYGVSFDWLLGHNYVLTANASMDRIKDVPVGFVSFFNTPTYRLNVGFSNTGMGYQKRIGFAAMMRNQDGFFYESDFRQGSIPGYTVIDAQVSYKFPKIRSLIKLGANNLTNKYYRTAFGNPGIGGLYYVSYGYNVF